MYPLEKFFIKNRKGQNIALIVEKPIGDVKDLAFTMHGLGGTKEQDMIRTISKAFLDNHCVSITFDTTNTFGESDGCYDDATTTNYLEDLEDVIKWTKDQSFYQEPFFLAGHSLGAFSVSIYTEAYNQKVKGLILVGTVVSGKLSMTKGEYFEEWKRLGYKEKISRSKPGVIGRLKWSHMEDRLKYDLLPNAYKLGMPVLMITGSEDISCPIDHQKKLFESLPKEKEFHIIKNAPHTFIEKEHLNQTYTIIHRWMEIREEIRK